MTSPELLIRDVTAALSGHRLCLRPLSVRSPSHPPADVSVTDSRALLRPVALKLPPEGGRQRCYFHRLAGPSWFLQPLPVGLWNRLPINSEALGRIFTPRFCRSSRALLFTPCCFRAINHRLQKKEAASWNCPVQVLSAARTEVSDPLEVLAGREKERGAKVWERSADLSGCIECRRGSLEEPKWPMGLFNGLWKAEQLGALDPGRSFSSDRRLCFENHQPSGFLLKCSSSSCVCAAAPFIHISPEAFCPKRFEDIKILRKSESRLKVSKH